MEKKYFQSVVDKYYVNINYLNPPKVQNNSFYQLLNTIII